VGELGFKAHDSRKAPRDAGQDLRGAVLQRHDVTAVQSVADPGLAKVGKQHRSNIRSRCAGEIDGAIWRNGFPLHGPVHLGLFKLAEEFVGAVIYPDEDVAGVYVCRKGQKGSTLCKPEIIGKEALEDHARERRE